MLFPVGRRSLRLARHRLRLFLYGLCAILILDATWIATSHPAPQRAASLPSSLGQKIFIAAIHRNTEFILVTEWNQALLNLTSYLGPKNVFVSIQESGSLDDTKGALRDLDFALKESGVHRSIKLGSTVEEQVAEVYAAPPEEQEGWIRTSRGKIELRRIPYLAKLRNQVMEALQAEAALGRKYDIVLWLNDVVFTTPDIVTLLATRDGRYDAACAVDFKDSPRSYYDTFALRDSSGQKAEPQTWPYFLSRSSRRAVMANEPVPVRSCWNGAVALKAEPFYDPTPLRFRGISDSLAKYHLEGSECCLIHVDYSHKVKDSQGVWVNPNVRVGYWRESYDAVNPSSGIWPGAGEKVRGLWANRLARWLGWFGRRSEAWTVQHRLTQWTDEHGETENGAACLINEMQVLFESGWEHV